MPIKNKRTLYTDHKIANARRNIRRFPWARRQRDRAVAEAAKWTAKGLDALWHLVMPQSLPRSLSVHYELGSPITGKRLLKDYGMYGWELEPDGEAWTIRDPSSGFLFPTNDFAAFYQSGRDRHGLFRRDLADESLLVNRRYPEKGPTWGVDDGCGWVDSDGEKWTFVAYYTHWTYSRSIEPAVRALRDAYLYTGDVSYARAGLVILDRLADLYPTYDVSVWEWDAGYKNSHGLTGQGKFIGSIWETGPAKTWLSAYDAFFSAVDDAELIRFLHAKAAQYKLETPKDSGDAIRENIERGIVGEILPSVKRAQIRGNHGMHESALAMAAVVLDDVGTPESPGRSDEIIRFIFQPGELTRNPWSVTGGDLLGTLVDHIDRDGMGTEASPSYNRLWLTGLRRVADVLAEYRGDPGADLYQNVKFKKLLMSQHPLLMLGTYTPQIGDTGSVANTGHILRAEDYVNAFERYEEPVAAQVAHFCAAGSGEEIHGDIFDRDPGAVPAAIEDLVKQEGPWDPPSVHLPGYGFVALRDGRVGDATGPARGLWLYFGRNGTSHAHADLLNIDVYAYDLSLAPDLGYPEKASSYPKRDDWTSNTVSHNTVVVDRGRQQRCWGGVPRHFDGTNVIRLIDVEAPEAYPHTSVYRRTVALIPIDESDSYIVDFFRIAGGNEHHYSFHGTAGRVVTEGLAPTPQRGGTYAGPDVAFQQKVDGSGFEWLSNVRCDGHPEQVYSVDWEVDDFRNAAPHDKNVHLRLTMANQVDSVSLADGEPPQKAGNPESLTYLIAHRKGEGLKSLFASILEPYKNTPRLGSVSRVAMVPESPGADPEECLAGALKIVLDDGQVDYIVTSLDTDQIFRVDDTFDFCGFFGVCRYTPGATAPVYAYVNDGVLIGERDNPEHTFRTARLKGEVLRFTEELSLTNQITIKLCAEAARDVEESSDLDLTRLAGSFLYIDNDRERNAAYQIIGAHYTGGGICTVDIGDTTLVRRLRDAGDPTAGYEFNIALGDAACIPLAWSYGNPSPASGPTA